MFSRQRLSINKSFGQFACLALPDAIRKGGADVRREGPSVYKKGARQRRIAWNRSQRCFQLRSSSLPARALATQACNQVLCAHLQVKMICTVSNVVLFLVALVCVPPIDPSAKLLVQERAR